MQLASIDPVATGTALGLLGGTLVSAVAAFVRARPAAQLDTVSAAKVIMDEQREELDRVRKVADDALACARRLEQRCLRLERLLEDAGLPVNGA